MIFGAAAYIIPLRKEGRHSVKQDLDQTIKDSDITADIRSASNDFKKSVDDARKSTGLKKP